MESMKCVVCGKEFPADDAKCKICKGPMQCKEGMCKCDTCERGQPMADMWCEECLTKNS